MSHCSKYVTVAVTTLAVLIWPCHAMDRRAGASVVTGSAVIDKSSPALATVPREYLGFGEEMDRVQDLLIGGNFENAEFQYLFKQLGPAYLRVGGITADWTYYEASSTGQRGKSGHKLGGYWPTKERPLSYHDFGRLCKFAKNVNFSLLFDLNELHGRNCHFNDTVKCVGVWNTTNMKQFLHYVHDNPSICPALIGFELGNELFTHLDINTNIADIVELVNIVNAIWNGETAGGSDTSMAVYGPSTDHCLDGQPFAFMNATRHQITGYTYHSYPNRNNINAGNLLNKTWLEQGIIQNDLHAHSIECIRAWQKTGQTAGMKLWVTETNSAYAIDQSPQGPILNRFLNGFWYLNSLAQYAATDAVTMHGRWCMSSGNAFGLVNDTQTLPLQHHLLEGGSEVESTGTYAVSTDYYVAVLYKRLVGEKVLPVTISSWIGGDGATVYAFCGAVPHLPAGSVVYVITNPTTDEVHVQVSGEASGTRQEYILTAGNSPGGNSTLMHSPTVRLNGDILPLFPGDTDFPPLDPRQYTTEDKQQAQQIVVMPPLSYGFVVLPQPAPSIPVCQP
eukprot:m.580439 g.580439  ORF g.580439 m.580439 type:complete len:563 (+) comp22323_c0_seq3:70-1758(+)